MRWLVPVACVACGRLNFDAVSVDASFTGQHVAYVKASNSRAGDNFGNYLAFDPAGDRVAVGAWLQDGGAVADQSDFSQPDSGAVYTFSVTGGAWAQDAYLKAQNLAAGDHFGLCMALTTDGTRLAVAAPGKSTSTGAAYIFDRTGATWTQTAYLTAANPDVNDTFGYQLAMSADGNTLAIGAFFEQSAATGIDGDQADNTADKAGAVYVFHYDAGWTQQAYIKASNTDAGDIFGEAVALSADGATLAVGAPLEASASPGIDGDQGDNSTPEAGAVYVFTHADAAWSQQAYIKSSLPGPYDQFGWGVALSGDGNVLAVGARGQTSEAGAAYVFHRAGAQWSQDQELTASNTQGGAQFGQVVALTPDGTWLIVTSPNEASDATGIDGNQTDTSAAGAGATYLFEHAAGTWARRHYIKQTNTDAGDELASGAMSADGATIGVGAQREDSSATGIDGNQADNSSTDSGAAYLYY